MSVIHNDLLLSSDDGYNLTRSLRFRSSASATLSRTPSSATNRKTWTWSAWVKLGAIGTNPALFQSGFSSAPWTAILLQSNGTFEVTYTAGSAVGSVSSAVFRDPSAWYHFVWVTDTTQATAANRVKLYVNGVQQTFSSANYPAQNFDTTINNTVAHTIGGWSGQYFDGYLTEVNFIDGQALTPSSFGATSSTTGVWQPKKYTGTYGTNGFYLPFTDNSALTSGSNAGLGKDFSGNGNYWNTNNISITSGSTYDSMTDVPTLTSATAANFAVMNPLDTNTAGSLRWGNLDSYGTSSATGIGSIWITSGKWYAEATIINRGGTSTAGTGFYIASASGVTRTGLNPNGTRRIDGTDGTSLSSAIANNDVIGLALDADAKTLGVYLNGSLQGTLTFTDSAPYTFNNDVRISGSTTNPDTAVNFGQQPWKYTPPTGYVALNTFNLPTPTIGATASSQANKYFDATLWTGNGTSTTVANAAGFQPDLVWGKSRSNAYQNILVDVLRGATTYLQSSTTAAEATNSTVVSAFTSTGFTVGSDATLNGSGTTNVAWQWKANGSGSSNTSGSITSTVSANTTSGFSVVTYTGTGSAATIGHGLGVAPKMIIVKQRNTSRNWAVWQTSLTGGQALFLDSTLGTQSDTTIWNNTTPTSSVFSVATSTYTNQSTGTYVAYCFAEVAGFSKFGSYTGNGSSDGSFIYTGFKPKFVLIKRTDSGNNWFILDGSRNTYNLTNAQLLPNSSAAESTGSDCNIDMLSNGFKLRTALDASNGSGGTYIYACFAENPFKYSLAR